MSRFKAGHPDTNQAEIVKAYRAMGCSVAITTQVGGGFPDLVVGRHGSDTLVEVKVKKGKLKQSQIDFHRDWKGKPIALIRSVDDAIRHITHGEYRRLDFA